MARKELTYQARSSGNGGRWCKHVYGQRVYFGNARSKSHADDYRKAVKAYRQHVAELARQAELAEASKVITTRLLEGVPFGQLDLPMLLRAISGTNPREMVMTVSPKSDITLDVTEQPSVALADLLVDQYLAHINNRRELTEANGKAVTPSMRLGASAYRTLKSSAEAIRKVLRKANIAGLDDMQAMEAALLKWRRELDAQVAAGDKTPSYAQVLTRAARPLFEMAWRARQIPELPRCLAEVTRKAAISNGGQAKPLNPASIAKLWAKANSRMKCYMALGLNCGCYAIDISDMRADELITRDGHTYLARRRSKTGAPGRWKLWPETVALIQRTREDQPDGRLFTAKRGGHIVRQTGKSTSDYLGREMLNLAASATVRASFSQMRDTGAAFIEGWGRERGDNLATSAYLAHADKRMARHYLSLKPTDLDTGRLDEATDALRKHLSLKL